MLSPGSSPNRSLRETGSTRVADGVTCHHSGSAREAGRPPMSRSGTVGQDYNGESPEQGSPTRFPRHPRGVAGDHLLQPQMTERAASAVPRHDTPSAGRVPHGLRRDGGTTATYRSPPPSVRRTPPPRVQAHGRRHGRGPTADDRRARPCPEALWPLARALVALAIEVRAEGLEVGDGWRSHGSVGKGGSRCVA